MGEIAAVKAKGHGHLAMQKFSVKSGPTSRPSPHSAFQTTKAEKRSRGDPPLVIPLASQQGSATALRALHDSESEMPVEEDDSSELAAAARIAELTSRDSQPLLAAGRLPGLAEISDETEKFRRDMSMRAEDVEASSDVYDRVPIEEFGAAALRGMGWTGPTKEDEARFAESATPRHHRLGLGALPKPREVFDHKGRLREGKTVDDAKKRRWLGASAEQSRNKSTRRFAVGDVVSYGKYRCRILELVESDRAVVQFERSAKRCTAHTSDLDRVSTQILLTNPFVSDVATNSANTREETSAAEAANSERRREGWLCAGIRVRVAREGNPHYKEKGVVLDVIREASGLRALLNLDSGRLVHEPGMREKHLQTALPKEGGRLKAVAGPHRGRVGHLVRREKSTVLLRFDDDSDIISVPKDDVAELCARADDD